MVDVCYAVFEEMDFETGLEEVFAGVADAEFGGYSAYVYVFGVEEFKDFAEGLACAVGSVEAGILFGGLVTAFVEGELFGGVRLEGFMDFSAAGSGYAVRGPDAAVFLE